MLKIFLFQAIQFSQTVLIQTIQFSISIVFVCTELNIKTVLFQAIQFSISTQFSSIWPIYGNEGALRIPQSSSITETSPSDGLVSYPGHSLGGILTPLQSCSRCILQATVVCVIHLHRSNLCKCTDRGTLHFISFIVVLNVASYTVNTAEMHYPPPNYVLFGLPFSGRNCYWFLARKGCNVRVCVYVELFPRQVLLSYIKERERFQDVRSRSVFMIVFNGCMVYMVCVCAASLVGKERSKETEFFLAPKV